MNPLTVRLARVPSWIIVASWLLWWAAALTGPRIYARLRGWGVYWALSFPELLETLLVLIVPPGILTSLWWRARRSHGGQGAA